MTNNGDTLTCWSISVVVPMSIRCISVQTMSGEHFSHFYRLSKHPKLDHEAEIKCKMRKSRIRQNPMNMHEFSWVFSMKMCRKRTTLLSGTVRPITVNAKQNNRNNNNNNWIFANRNMLLKSLGCNNSLSAPSNLMWVEVVRAYMNTQGDEKRWENIHDEREKKNQFTNMERATAMTITEAASNNFSPLLFFFSSLLFPVIKCISIAIESKSMSCECNQFLWRNNE